MKWTKVSHELKESYWKAIANIITVSLRWKWSGKPGVFEINWRKFSLYEGSDTVKGLKARIANIEEILNSRAGYYFPAFDREILIASMESAERTLEKYWDEYDDFGSMKRIDFFAKTRNKSLLKEYIDDFDGNSSYPETTETVALAKKRLEALENQGELNREPEGSWQLSFDF